MPGATINSHCAGARPSWMRFSAAFSAATSIATGSMSEAAARAVGQSRIAAKASSPVPVPRSSRLAKCAPVALSRSSARRQPVVVSCCPVPNARPASISNAMAPSGTASRCDGVCTKKRPARIGSSPAWLSVTQSSSPSRSTAGAAPAALGTRLCSKARSRGPAPPRNRHRAAKPRPPPRWSSAPAANREARMPRYPPSVPSPRSWCRAA